MGRSALDRIALMENRGPVLTWEGPNNPTCNGSCARGWTFGEKSGYWLCGGCYKPSHANLFVCDICDVVWLPAASLVEARLKGKLKYQLPRQLDHTQCEMAVYGELQN